MERWGRVIQALRFLNLIAEDGVPTETLKAIAGAPENEAKSLLETTVRAAYATDLHAIDPGQDAQSQISDWFQRYQPRSQTSRMVMLFLSLCREAGIPVKDKQMNGRYGSHRSAHRGRLGQGAQIRAETRARMVRATLRPLLVCFLPSPRTT